MMDDYFTEGEKKSREVDFTPSAKSTPPPPPPKSKGPPKAGDTVGNSLKGEDRDANKAHSDVELI